MIKLVQKRLFDQRVFTLGEKTLHARSKSLKQTLEYEVALEKIGLEVVRKVDTANQFIPLVFALSSLLMLGLLIDSCLYFKNVSMVLFWSLGLFFFGVLAVSSTYNRIKRFVYLTGGDHTVELYETLPDADTVNTFVETTQNHVRCWLKQKFYQYDPFLSYEYQLTRFQWLKESSVITEDEYDSIVQQMRGQSNQQPIGFND